MPSKLTLGFVGTGKMATALARGIVRAGLLAAGQLYGSDPVRAARVSFARLTGARLVASNRALLERARVIVLAVKPDQVGAALGEIRDGWTEQHLLISIAAGVSIARLETALPGGARVVRAMPNTPALVGAGATGLAAGNAATAADLELAVRLFSAVGIAIPLKESLLDAVTGLSGSGPAYVYQFIEALSDGGVAAGLTREVATKLAAQTVLGAARMVLETGEHPGALKDKVASPGGTTIEGLHELEKGKLRATVINAVRAATEKSRKLGQSA